MPPEWAVLQLRSTLRESSARCTQLVLEVSQSVSRTVTASTSSQADTTMPCRLEIWLRPWPTAQELMKPASADLPSRLSEGERGSAWREQGGRAATHR